jgi:hypothetical protein
MKKSFLLLTLSFLFVIAGKSQFVEYNGLGKVCLISGDTVSGYLSHSPSSSNSVFITPDGEKKAVKYKPEELSGFSILDKTWFTEVLKGLGSVPHFVQAVNPVDYKIRLYLYETQNSITTGGVAEFKQNYYVFFPGKESAISIGDLSLRPIDEKISELVSDCAELSLKIKNKEKGYFFGAISSDEMKLEVFKTIAAEYQTCNR